MARASKKIIIFILPLMLLMSVLSSFECSARISNTVIPEDAVELGGHYYKLYDDIGGFEKTSWDKAKKACEQRGGYLAAVTSAEEDAFLYDYCSDSGYSDVFFGLYYSGDKWKWVSGEKFDYSNWAADKPNGTKAESHGQYSAIDPSGRWNNGEFKLDGTAYLCEWEEGAKISEAEPADGETSIDKDRSKRHGDSYYRVFNTPLDHGDAARLCSGMGGHLVYITDKDEQKFINELIKKKGSRNMYWIGAVRGDNGWGWQDGSGMDSYSAWTKKKLNNSDPDAQFAAINTGLKKYDKNRWVAEPAYGSVSDESESCINYGFVCEWDIVCKSDDGEFITHQPGDWQTEAKSTCTEPGKRTRYCKRCGEVAVEEDIEPKPHNFVEKGLSFPGYKELVCVNCGTYSHRVQPGKVWILPFAVILYFLLAAAYVKARSDFEHYARSKGISVVTKRIPLWAFAILPTLLALLMVIVWILA